MTDDSGLNEDFNNAMEDLLPEDVDQSEVDPESEKEGTDQDHYWGRVLQEWHSLASVDEYRRNELVEREIDHHGDQLDLSPKVRDMAKQLFDRYLETQEHLIIELTTAAAVYAAVRVNEVGITPERFVEAGRGPLNRIILLRRTKDIVNELGLNPEAFFNSEIYVDEFCSKLELPSEINDRAKQILTYCDEAGISSGKSPTGWTAAAIYLACIEQDMSTSQDDIGEVADVSTVTVRNRYQEQRDVVVKRESPDEISAVVNWVCERTNLSEVIRADAMAYVESDPDLKIRGSHNIPLSFDEDPTGWGMAAVKLAAENNNHDLTYRPWKSLSGYKATNLKRRVHALKNASGTVHRSVDDLEEGIEYDEGTSRRT